jgi:predicted GTPase
LFLHNQPIDAKLDLDINKDSIKEISATEDESRLDKLADENIHILDEQEFSDYLEGNGDWKFAQDMYVFSNTYISSGERIQQGVLPLGKVVDTIFETIAVPEPLLHDSLQLSQNPLKIAILGKPCAGKAAVARDLAEKYGIDVISVNRLVETAIAQAAKILSKEDLNASQKASINEVSLIGAKVYLLYFIFS